MPIFIDANNLIHACPSLRNIAEGQCFSTARDIMLRRLSRSKLFNTAEFHVFFDGTGGRDAMMQRTKMYGIYVIYSGATREADDEIISDIHSSLNPELIEVATNDRELQKSCRQAGAKIRQTKSIIDILNIKESSSTLSDEISKEKRDGLSSKEELNKWMEIFGEEDKIPDA